MKSSSTTYYSRIREIDMYTEIESLHTELEEGKKENLDWKTLHFSFLLDRVLIHTKNKNKNVRRVGFKESRLQRRRCPRRQSITIFHQNGLRLTPIRNTILTAVGKRFLNILLDKLMLSWHISMVSIPR
jgi:hypothetical protein